MRAETLAKALGGRKAGGGWTARCPAHDDREPSLSICDADDGKVLLHCHAGCGQERVISALRSSGLWVQTGHHYFTRRVARPAANHRLDRDEAKRREAALAIWGQSISAAGTLAEPYLASRGLRLSPSERIRFHLGLKHPAGGVWPAMVALITRGEDDAPLAIHRTYLAHEGSGKAPVDPQRMMLGPCHGGAVRLSPLGDVLMVGEGIETCLAAMQVAGYAAWAALSTSGLRALDLPREVRHVIVLADGDAPGELAAQDCAWRWSREGRHVRIARPPQGMDINDLMVRPASCIGETAR